MTRAASDLEMPRSTAIKLLADLESRLGEKLVKSSRTFGLTDEGARYFGQVRPLMAHLGTVDAEFGNPGARPPCRTPELQARCP